MFPLVAFAAIALLAGQPASSPAGEAAPIVTLEQDAAEFFLDPRTDGFMFGYAVLTLDDVDGLGLRDFAVSAPIWSPYVGSGLEGGVVVFSAERRTPLRRIDGPESAFRFGSKLALVGDVDGDERREMLVGADKSFGATDSAWIVSSVTGVVIHHLAVRASSIAAVHDVDGDGLEDLALVRPRELELVSGRDLACIASLALEEADPILEALPDLDGDQRPELVVRDIDESGRARILFGVPQQTELVIDLPFVEAEYSRSTEWRVAVAGDHNGDGRSDIWISVSDMELLEGLGTALVDTRSGAVLERDPSPDWNGSWNRTLLWDLDGDALVDPVVALPASDFESSVEARSARRGVVLWRSARGAGNARPASSLAILDDETGDGVPDILVGAGDFSLSHGRVSRDDRIMILSGRDGHRLWRMSGDDVPMLPRWPK